MPAHIDPSKKGDVATHDRHWRGNARKGQGPSIAFVVDDSAPLLFVIGSMMITRLPALLVILLAVLAGARARAADWCVDDSNTTGEYVGSATRPFATIAQAVAAAKSSDRIQVAAGSYSGGIRVEGKTLELWGGYPGGTTTSYENGDPGDFITAFPETSVSTIVGSPADSCVLFINAGESRLWGFRVTNGGGANEDAFRSQGGGVYIDGGSPTIERCEIRDNDARDPKIASFGGGIYTREAATTILNCVVASNDAGRGAGIAVGGGTVRIAGNTIADNIGNDDHGGGIYAFSENILIEENIISGNEIGRELGYGWGGGIIVFNPGASALIRNNDVYNNYAASNGGGVFIDEAATATMENCRIYGNLGEEQNSRGGILVDGGVDGGSTLTMRHCTVWGHVNPEFTLGGNGLFVSGDSAATAENCIFWGNSGASVFGPVSVTYSTTEEPLPGIGNITSDPLIHDPQNGDLHLRSTAGRWNAQMETWEFDAVHSPAIDAGNPASPFNLEPQGNGGRANQGAYGNSLEASRTTVPTVSAPTGLAVR